MQLIHEDIACLVAIAQRSKCLRLDLINILLENLAQHRDSRVFTQRCSRRNHRSLAHFPFQADTFDESQLKIMLAVRDNLNPNEC